MKPNHPWRDPYPYPLPNPCSDKLVLLLGHLGQLSLIMTNKDAPSQGPPCAENLPMDTYAWCPSFNPNPVPNPTPASIQCNTDSQNTSTFNNDPNKDVPSQGPLCSANPPMDTYPQCPNLNLDPDWCTCLGIYASFNEKNSDLTHPFWSIFNKFFSHE